MEQVKKLVLEKAIRLLDSLKLDYVIVIPDGDRIIKGDISVVEKKKRRNRTAPIGTYSTLFRSFGVDSMKAGDVLVIPCKTHDPQVVRKTLAAHCVNIWGSGSAITSINKDHVEIMRLYNGK